MARGLQPRQPGGLSFLQTVHLEAALGAHRLQLTAAARARRQGAVRLPDSQHRQTVTVLQADYGIDGGYRHSTTLLEYILREAELGQRVKPRLVQEPVSLDNYSSEYWDSILLNSCKHARRTGSSICRKHPRDELLL